MGTDYLGKDPFDQIVRRRDTVGDFTNNVVFPNLVYDAVSCLKSATCACDGCTHLLGRGASDMVA